jgi:hypothetical protein
MTCWVPILVAFRRPDLIQRRTVSGSRLVRRAASGTVSIVARYYNNSINEYSNADEKPWQEAARSEFEQVLLNGAQRSVNRKVQGSNPCSGAKTELEPLPATAIQQMCAQTAAA